MCVLLKVLQCGDHADNTKQYRKAKGHNLKQAEKEVNHSNHCVYLMCVVCVLHESLDAVQCIHDQCTGYTIPDAALIAVHPFSEVLFESTYHAIGANLNRWDWRISLDCNSWFVHRVSLSCVVVCHASIIR